MKDELRKPFRTGKNAQPTRKLNFPSRVRGKLRGFLDRVLGAEIVWSGIWVAAVVVLLGNQSCSQSLEQFAVGDVAPQDIKAAHDMDVVDEVLTEQRRHEAQDQVPEVYVHDAERGVRLARELSTLMEDGRAILEGLTARGVEQSLARAAEEMAGRVPDPVLSVLLQHRFDVSLEFEMNTVLTQVMSGLVVGNLASLERLEKFALIRVADRWEEERESSEGIVDLVAAREIARKRLMQRLSLPADEERRLAQFVSSYVDANVQPDPGTTERRRDDAARSVPLVLVRIGQGELLVKKGERFTPELVSMLSAARRSANADFGWRYLVGLFFVATTLAFFLYRYTRYHQRKFRKIRYLHALLVMMLLSMLGLAEAILWLATEIAAGRSLPFSRLDTYIYLVPLGAGSILIALLANGRIAIVYSAFCAMLYGAMSGWSGYVTVWAMLVQCAGVYAISTYRERAALLRAGLVVGGAGAASALAMEAIQGNLDPLAVSLYGATLAFMGGAVGVGLLVSFSLPMLEWIFNVLTDIRLLELSNINNPLLSELAIKAPGSYNHSLVVGTLAEEGAKAIGANTLFCRVAAFYHDIGKINKPEYYVENQRGNNPHDRLAPSMSALIIASHVKDGIKMAREAGLPEQIIDIIPQHHGTKKMTYFYEKAKSSADPSLGPVKEEDFRYSGPKPQTREAAIFMLADAVEAAARTIDEPTANRLGEMISKVSNAIVLDGQLDSCDLTFADLQRIQDAFQRLLVSMYHHRVDYPGFDFGKSKDPGNGKEPRDKEAEARAPGDVKERKVAR